MAQLNLVRSVIGFADYVIIVRNNLPEKGTVAVLLLVLLLCVVTIAYVMSVMLLLPLVFICFQTTVLVWR